MRRLVVVVAICVCHLARADEAKPPAESPEVALQKLLGKLDAVAKEVAAVRGLKITRAIPNDVVDKDQLRKRIVDWATEEKAKAEMITDAIAARRWGLVPAGTNLEQLMVDLLTEQIAGYYDPKTKALTISKSAGADPNMAEFVLAHELDHALQDMAFDLKKFQDLPPDQDDATLARRALVEGDGMALMLEVIVGRNGMKVPWSDPDVTATLEKSMSTPGATQLDRAPFAVREGMIFPYRAGLAFVAALRRRAPWSAVDAAFVRPPKSTEQVLHPDRYVKDEAPIPIALPAPAVLRGFSIIDDSIWGEFGFATWFRGLGVDATTAQVAADGWGGDRSIVLGRPGATGEQAVAISRSEWDTEADAIEAAEAAIKAVDALVVGALVDHESLRWRWLGADGRVYSVERREKQLAIVIGCPLWAYSKLALF